MRTPTPEFTLATVIDAALRRVNTAIPGTVVEYDPEKKLASVQPAIRKLLPGGDLVELPTIHGVPVVFPTAAGGKATITIPVKKGDPVLVIFSQASLDAWIERGAVADPVFDHHHDLSDAIAIPGLEPAADPAPAHPDNVEVRFGNFVISISPDEKVAIGTDQVELLDTLIKLIEALQKTTVQTMAGPQLLSASIDGTLESLKNSIASIAGTI